MQLKILNTREVKKIKQLLVEQFDYALREDYAYLMNQKERIFLVNKDLAKIDMKNLRVDRIGLYFGELKPNHIRLSKEGAALFVKEAKDNKKIVKNLIDLSKEEVQKYFRGEDLIKDLGEDNKPIILEYDNNVIGCASYKEGKILNFLPKIHRGEVIV
jgi:NOL1/NOP2/fmu family ribosome biogenesis protein